MNHSELTKLREKFGEPVAWCEWCYRPHKETSLRNFLGFGVCWSCYNRIRQVLKNGSVKNLLDWIANNIETDAKITKNSDFFVYRISVKIRQTENSKEA